jgi:predicted glycosyltransferase
LSISQAGYNTVCDILQAGCASVLVPFSSGGETEQTARAERLERLGLAIVIPENVLSAETMAGAISSALQAGTKKNVPVLQLDGANRTAKILRALLKQRATS